MTSVNNWGQLLKQIVFVIHTERRWTANEIIRATAGDDIAYFLLFKRNWLILLFYSLYELKLHKYKSSKQMYQGDT